MKLKFTQLNVFFLFVLLGLGLSSQGQTKITTADTVCAGTQDVVYGITSANPTSTFTWYIDAAAGGAIDNSISIPDSLVQIDWGSTPGNYTVYAVETTEWGCVGDSVQLDVTINPLPSALVVSDSVCEGFEPTLTFTVSGQFPVTIDFTDGTNNYSTVAAATPHTYTFVGSSFTAGNHTIDITSVTDDNSCSEVAPSTGNNITIHPRANTGGIYHY